MRSELLQGIANIIGNYRSGELPRSLDKDHVNLKPCTLMSCHPSVALSASQCSNKIIIAGIYGCTTTLDTFLLICHHLNMLNLNEL